MSRSVRPAAGPIDVGLVARSALTTNSNGVLTFTRYESGERNSGDVEDRPHHLAQIAIGLR